MDELPNGIQVTVGAGLGFDVHFRQTQTRNIGIWKLW